MIPNRAGDVRAMTPSSAPRSTIGTAFRFQNTEHCSGLQTCRRRFLIGVADSGSEAQTPGKRSAARRNEETLLAAAAAAFVASGVDVPVRDIAARAGIGVGTMYRHFPTRGDLVVAVYRPQ